MARDETARNSPDDGLFDRRSYLKFAGATAASFAAIGTTAAKNYRTITVPAGQMKRISVGDGETFENVLIDMTAKGASAMIVAEGSNWTIRNVGFKGIHPGGHFLIVPGVQDPNGTALIENVYMGDGEISGSQSGGVWMNANLPHRGTVVFRNIHIAGMTNNGLYGSGPGAKGYGGNLHVHSSYFKSNTISNVRLNAKDHLCRVTDTVVDARNVKPCGGGCSDPGATTTRAVWSWYGETHVKNCDLVGPVATAHGGSVTKTNTRIGDEADLTPPKGVPMTAEQAASGAGGSPGNRKQAAAKKTAKVKGLPNSISISSTNASKPASYEFEVAGKVKKSTARGASKDDDDSLTHGTAKGSVAGGTDSYQFSGTLTTFKLDGNATVYFNGERVTPGKLGLPKTLVIDGTKTDGSSGYSFDVGGSVAKSAGLGSVNKMDTVEGTRVTGKVFDGKDGYRFSGDLKRLQVNGKATISVGTGSD